MLPGLLSEPQINQINRITLNGLLTGPHPPAPSPVYSTDRRGGEFLWVHPDFQKEY